MSLFKEIFEDIKDLGEYATKGFYHEVIKGEDNYIPTYEKNRMANSMVSSARHSYNETKERYEIKFNTVKQNFNDFCRLKESCLHNEMSRFERYIANASLSNQLKSVKQNYFQHVPVQNQIINRFDMKIPEAPRTRFELDNFFLLFRIGEADDNLSDAKAVKSDILRAKEQLEFRITALDNVLNRIKEFQSFTKDLSQNLNAVNQKISLSGTSVNKNTLDLGMVYISLLYIVVSTDIFDNREVSHKSQEVLKFIKSTLGGLQ